MLLAIVPLMAVAGCANTGTSDAPASPTVDRRDAESVLRAYFDAWARGDLSEQVSFMGPTYAGLVAEPVNSLEVVKITLPTVKEPENVRRYYVTFDIEVPGQHQSMSSGRYMWEYELTWNGELNSWLITNYGY